MSLIPPQSGTGGWRLTDFFPIFYVLLNSHEILTALNSMGAKVNKVKMTLLLKILKRLG
jgi:phage-related holin